MLFQDARDPSPLHTYYREKARDLPQGPQASSTAPAREVPAQFRDRFSTYEQYQEAMADFLNGL